MSLRLCFSACALLTVAQITAVFAADLNDNPLAAKSVLPYQYPAFDRIKDEHFVPAIEAGMGEQLKEVEAVAKNSEQPTFDNTIVALERTGAIARPSAAHVFEPQRMRYKPDTTEDRQRNSTETCRAPGRDF